MSSTICAGPAVTANDGEAQKSDLLGGEIDNRDSQTKCDSQLSDVAWFERHPHENLRIRDAFTDELDDETARVFQVAVTKRAAIAGQITAYIMRGVLSP
jgi:hypothetical protein